MIDRKHQKKIEQIEYRAKLAELELNAIKGSKSYRMAKTLGGIRSQLRKDPIGLPKKIIKKIIQEPSNARHLLRIANRGAFIANSVQQDTGRYQEWILLNEPDEMELEEQRKASGNFAYQPTISIITPVFNPPVQVLEELIESVLEQSYPNFELCIGNFGDDPAVRVLIDKYADLDDRVKNYLFTENKGISGNSNAILDKVRGEFIALLDHDDTLSPNALYENVVMLNEKPYDFLYSDKDKIDERGNRFEPLFKPQFSPEMLLNINYLTHLNVIRTEIVRKIEGWDSATDGAQDWDLFLRVIAKSKHIGHIPKVLYHWRVLATSTAMSIESKPYALAGQRRAVDKFLRSQHIPAVSYHKKTEMFLEWDKKTLDNAPVVLIFFSTLTNTSRLIRSVSKAVAHPHFIVMVPDAVEAKKLAKLVKHKVMHYGKDGFGKSLQEHIKDAKTAGNDHTVLVLRDDIRFPQKNDWYERLTGWLTIDKVAAAAGRLVDRHDLIVRCAGVVAPNGAYVPLFYKLPRFYQSYLGNAEWVRDVSIVPAAFVATKLSLLQGFAERRLIDGSPRDFFDAYFLSFSPKYRIVMTPHATASIYEDNGEDGPRRLPIHKSKQKVDKYSSPNVSPSDPMRIFEDESLAGTATQEEGPDAPVDRYQHDAIILAGTFDISRQELDENKRLLQTSPTRPAVSVAWLLPSYDAVYAGLMNIFSFADYMITRKKMQITFYILKDKVDATKEHRLASDAFVGLKKAKFVGITPDQVDKIHHHDIGIATQWATAFPLARTPNIQRKYYFIQDNEVNFYPKGTISALVEQTYRFGFTAIAGTQGLLDMYSRNYSGRGMVLKSKVDLSSYHPRQNKYYEVKKPYKVFFYARPNMARNAFELGIAGLKILKQELGDDIEVITAGAAWNAADYGVEGMFTNLGKLSYKAVPKLYRSVDAGLMFMFSGHPGVTASELMASGCPVVVNEYDDTTWHELYQHEKTCLISLPTASEVARNLKRCLTDKKLRKRLIDGGLDKVRQFYDGYEDSLEEVWGNIKKQ